MLPSETNDGVFELLDVVIGARGPNDETAVILTLKNEEGEIINVANNWARGLHQRYELALKLIGKKIRYSTWNKDIYSNEWFKEIELFDREKDAEKRKKIKRFYKKMNDFKSSYQTQDD